MIRVFNILLIQYAIGYGSDFYYRKGILAFTGT